MSLHQDFYGNDFLKRVNFCNGIRRKTRTVVSFLSHVLLSDENNFANTGNVNREDVLLHFRMNMWMQHDGAPPYYALCSRQVMNGFLTKSG